MFIRNDPLFLERRRKLRNNSTEAERILWKYLQKSKLGYKIRRQYSFGNYIFDFYCPEKRVVIELDGGIHNLRKEEDDYRTKTIEQYEMKVIRFKNSEIEDNIGNVVLTILNILGATPS